MNKLVLPHDHGNSHTAEHLYNELKRIDRIQIASEMYKHISDVSKLRIFLILSHQEECITNMSAMLGITSPAVSHHLNSMKKCGLVESRRNGKEVYYKTKDNEICRLLHDITEHIMEIGCPAKKNCCNSSKDIIKDVHKYLITHLHERISIEKLSKKFLINPTTLKQKFKEVYETSIAVHTNLHRMETASKMLLTTDNSVLEIAGNVGFTSQSKFTVSFKQYYGLTPTEYRNCKGKTL